jgi:hypothetical protein
MTLDLDYLRTLHAEAIEQLELMQTAIDTAEQSTGTMRDTLDDMATDHWHAYLDVMHMIALHDDAMASTMKKYGMKLRDSEDCDNENSPFSSRLLLGLLLKGLLRRHRRIWTVYGYHGNPMNDYLRESITMEREHMAEMIQMVQNII